MQWGRNQKQIDPMLSVHLVEFVFLDFQKSAWNLAQQRMRCVEKEDALIAEELRKLIELLDLKALQKLLCKDEVNEVKATQPSSRRKVGLEPNQSDSCILEED